MSIVQDFPRAAKDLSSGIGLYQIWAHLALNDVFAKYRRSLFGPFWIAGSMVASSIALAIVFGSIFEAKLADILPYIMAGLVVWGFIGLVFAEGCDTFVGAAGMIKSTPFPYSLHIFRLILRNLVIMGHNLVVLFIVQLIFTHRLSISYQVVPGMLLMSLFTFFTCGTVGIASARFRDLRFLLPYIGQIAFMVTPIIWKVDQVHDSRKFIYAYNPFYYFLKAVREPLLGLNVGLGIWGICAALTAGAGLVWWLTFAAFRKRIAFWV